MLPLSLSTKTITGPTKVLCLGAHSDDIEIGCGGTILSLCRLIPTWSAIGRFSAQAMRNVAGKLLKCRAFSERRKGEKDRRAPV